MKSPVDEAGKARWERLEALFDIALDLPAEEQEAFLARWERRKPDLIAELRSLLAATREDSGMLDSGPLALIEGAARETPVKLAAGPAQSAMPEVQPGARIGAWKILTLIASGGMGTVYLAERADGAFVKRAAVKLIRSERVDLAARLKTERELLARLEHPNIARLLDGGVSHGGQPFLVMEWVDGVPIDQWCRSNRASLQQRLDVFLQVCQAVTYAHRNLIVHRDIKPGNILVTADGSVKLLDFGIARLMDPQRTLAETGAAALTPEYAAPEQLQAAIITTRTDVFALGGLLYQLLSGKAPLPLSRLSLVELVRQVCETVPPLCSESSDPDQNGIATSALRGDLDSIIAKALEKDPERRYQSVDALVRDIQRYRSGHPVKARPASLWYRSSLALKRHWLSATLSTVTVSVLLVAAVGLGWQARVVSAERDLARFEAARADAIREYMMLMLRNAAEEAGQAEAIDAKAMLDAAAARIEIEFATQPDVRDSILLGLAELYALLSDFRGALPLLERFIELDDGHHPAHVRAFAFDLMGLVTLRMGDPAKALDWVDRAMVLAVDTVGDERGSLANVLVTRGMVLRGLARSAEAVTDLEQAVALRLAHTGAVHRQTAVARNSLAIAYASAGRLPEALEEFAATWSIWEALDLAKTSDAANTINNWAAISHSMGQLEQAERLYQRALELRRINSGRSGGLAALQSNYARLKLLRDEAAQALPLAEDALLMMEEATAPDSIDAATVRIVVAEALAHGARFGEAAAALQRAEEVFLERFSAEHPFVARIAISRAELLELQGRLQEAYQETSAAEPPLRAAGDGMSHLLATSLCQQARLLIKLERGEQARPRAAECLQLRIQRHGEQAWESAEARLLGSAAAGNASPVTGATPEENDLQLLENTLGTRHSRVVELRLMLDAAR